MKKIVFLLEKVWCAVALASLLLAIAIYFIAPGQQELSIKLSLGLCLSCLPVGFLGKLFYWERSKKDSNRILAALVIGTTWWFFAIAVGTYQIGWMLISIICGVTCAAFIVWAITLLRTKEKIVVTAGGYLKPV